MNVEKELAVLNPELEESNLNEEEKDNSSEVNLNEEEMEALESQCAEHYGIPANKLESKILNYSLQILEDEEDDDNKTISSMLKSRFRNFIETSEYFDDLDLKTMKDKLNNYEDNLEYFAKIKKSFELRNVFLKMNFIRLLSEDGIVDKALDKLVFKSDEDIKNNPQLIEFIEELLDVEVEFRNNLIAKYYNELNDEFKKTQYQFTKENLIFEYTYSNNLNLLYEKLDKGNLLPEEKEKKIVEFLVDRGMYRTVLENKDIVEQQRKEKERNSEKNLISNRIYSYISHLENSLTEGTLVNDIIKEMSIYKSRYNILTATEKKLSFEEKIEIYKNIDIEENLDSLMSIVFKDSNWKIDEDNFSVYIDILESGFLEDFLQEFINNPYSENSQDLTIQFEEEILSDTFGEEVSGIGNDIKYYLKKTNAQRLDSNFDISEFESKYFINTDSNAKIANLNFEQDEIKYLVEHIGYVYSEIDKLWDKNIKQTLNSVVKDPNELNFILENKIILDSKEEILKGLDMFSQIKKLVTRYLLDMLDSRPELDSEEYLISLLDSKKNLTNLTILEEIDEDDLSPSKSVFKDKTNTSFIKHEKYITLKEVIKQSFKKGFLEVYSQKQLPLYDKLFNKFDNLKKNQDNSLEVYLGRDGIYAYEARKSQDIFRRKFSKNLKDRDNLHIRTKYMVFPRNLVKLSPDIQKEYIEDQGFSKEDLEDKAIFYDTGFEGTIPFQIMNVLGFDEKEAYKRIKLLSSPYEEIMADPKIYQDLFSSYNSFRDNVVEIEHSAKQEKTAEGGIL